MKKGLVVLVVLLGLCAWSGRGWGQGLLSRPIWSMFTGFLEYPLVYGDKGSEPIVVVWRFDIRHQISEFRIYRSNVNSKPTTPYVIIRRDSLENSISGFWDITTWWEDGNVEFNKPYFYWITASNLRVESEPLCSGHLSEVTSVTNIKGERLQDGKILWTWDDAGMRARMHYIFDTHHAPADSDRSTGRIGGVEYINSWVGPANVDSIKIYSYIDGKDFGVSGGSETDFSEIGYLIDTSVKSDINLSPTPSEFKLHQNHPNPFNPTTIISYDLPLLGHVILKVYNFQGQEVATLVDGYQEIGSHKVAFNVTNLPSGTYFYRLQAGKFVETKKMVVVK